jgi:NitT/TauT family transport system substrate-binding protein
MTSRYSLSRRAFIQTSMGVASAAALRIRPARAATKIRLLMNWFAEAEHGGFFQAKATGLYDQAGLDVELAQGGPQLNSMQLLVGGRADMILGYDLQILAAVESGLPVRAVAATFQIDLQGLLARPPIKSLAELKGHKIFIAASGHASYWPWLKQTFGYTDEMAAPKGVGLQGFLNDPTSAVAGYITAEPFTAVKANVPTNFLLFSDEGWPAYTNPIVTTNDFIAREPDAVRSFLRASMQGWKDYLKDPAAGNALIKEINPKMEDEQIAFSLAKMKEIHAIESGDAATMGIGIMTKERWQKTRDFMVSAGVLKPETDWTQAFTTDYIKDVRVMM